VRLKNGRTRLIADQNSLAAVRFQAISSPHRKFLGRARRVKARTKALELEFKAIFLGNKLEIFLRSLANTHFKLVTASSPAFAGRDEG